MELLAFETRFRKELTAFGTRKGSRSLMVGLAMGEYHDTLSEVLLKFFSVGFAAKLDFGNQHASAEVQQQDAQLVHRLWVFVFSLVGLLACLSWRHTHGVPRAFLKLLKSDHEIEQT